ncbi:rrp-1, partial [Pristionchus pacificus]
QGMDVDLESVEIVFAQRLASGEPPVRAHALRELHKWIKSQSAKKPFGEEDLMRLCKGLHYVMWMQDKMILQEELADNIASLVNIFESEDERALYVQCFFAALSKEWLCIDRWRMDKFLMLIRRLVRTAFLHLASLKWKKSVTEKYWNAFRATVMSNDRSFRDALKFHFASIFLDELDNAGSITTERVTDLVATFAQMLTLDISDYIFSSVVDEIFTTILHAMSDEMEGDEEEEEGEGEGEVWSVYIIHEKVM